MTVSVRRNEGSPASRLKTLSYLDSVLAKLEARDRGGDEALMLNNAGQLASGAASNLFWITGGRLYTPGLDCGVLHGTMRARVLDAAASLGIEAMQVSAGLQALEGAEGVFLTSSLLKVREVSELDGQPIPSSPLTARLSSRCR